MMEPEGDHRNSIVKHIRIEFGLVWFVLTSILVLDGNQSLVLKRKLIKCIKAFFLNSDNLLIETLNIFSKNLCKQTQGEMNFYSSLL